ncbi:hypothetical protein B7C42_07778 [Nocardia cerradoensis]|uniref:DUF2971 domain-containing protein n=1 Tax=Nocardia cerradoensis TaxID=85688 RepID=A0A231GU53_9NOCA|nr:DUF2971 domain-containing protein [Nocardia cerradoensis]OXR40154.1 hypothetical protein B7C42_07778 [Nocardia cerradoensis]
MTDADSWNEEQALASQISWRDLNAEYSNDQQWYHYTDIYGLQGILDSGEIWLTHMAYLNDSQEFEYGIGVICDVIKYQADWFKQNPEKTTRPESVEFVAELYHTMASGLARNAGFLKNAHAPFIACLSRSRDQLSQWRGYANGGYAIAFDSKLLKDSFAIVDESGATIPGHEKPRVAKASYLNYPVEEQVGKIVQARITDTSEAITAKDDAKAEEAAQAFTDSVIEIVSTLKHQKFFEEHEYRIISRCRESFFTPSSLGLIPRAKTSYDKKAVREVIVGPGAFAELRKASLERYFEERRDHFGDVAVTQSEIPYREV